MGSISAVLLSHHFSWRRRKYYSAEMGKNKPLAATIKMTSRIHRPGQVNIASSSRDLPMRLERERNSCEQVRGQLRREHVPKAFRMILKGYATIAERFALVTAPSCQARSRAPERGSLATVTSHTQISSASFQRDHSRTDSPECRQAQTPMGFAELLRRQGRPLPLSPLPRLG
jgi:hypothetical protein